MAVGTDYLQTLRQKYASADLTQTTQQTSNISTATENIVMTPKKQDIHTALINGGLLAEPVLSRQQDQIDAKENPGPEPQPMSTCVGRWVFMVHSSRCAPIERSRRESIVTIPAARLNGVFTRTRLMWPAWSYPEPRLPGTRRADEHEVAPRRLRENAGRRKPGTASTRPRHVISGRHANILSTMRAISLAVSAVYNGSRSRRGLMDSVTGHLPASPP